jgi:hypothetical protein
VNGEATGDGHGELAGDGNGGRRAGRLIRDGGTTALQSRPAERPAR